MGWYYFYDQQYSDCVGYSESRCMSLLNRERYAAHWLYRMAQIDAGQPADNDSGTFVRSGFNVLMNKGHRQVIDGVAQPVERHNGISAYRWGNVETALETLYNPASARHYVNIGGVPLLNSWGTGYPHLVWLTLESLATLWERGGEIGVPTDR
jgi:hypothetical protein